MKIKDVFILEEAVDDLNEVANCQCNKLPLRCRYMETGLHRLPVSSPPVFAGMTIQKD